ncbi:carboxymuconolactone decarboxylase family protein [Methanobacterium alcaliphilum]|uniref:carboxymuconolactone decarboxylase family protein n=1 Tax=Methanobacterium alcaliphilum TaxID=392018 RepID=UPI00200B5101|nr:carboxymuconolactone decarboxylase family protein [Methanobacterium alcaliphilum]MCK9152273.1 carboxymuconolactone decarboxylase family protein [Methanobacterium alcaliphilum]
MSSLKDIIESRETNEKRLSNEAPDFHKGFRDRITLYYKGGALSTKYKYLMAVTAAIATKCKSCMILDANKAIIAGTTKEEVIGVEAIGIEFGGASAYVMVRNNLLTFLDEME